MILHEIHTKQCAKTKNNNNDARQIYIDRAQVIAHDCSSYSLEKEERKHVQRKAGWDELWLIGTWWGGNTLRASLCRSFRRRARDGSPMRTLVKERSLNGWSSDLTVIVVEYHAWTSTCKDHLVDTEVVTGSGNDSNMKSSIIYKNFDLLANAKAHLS